MNWAEVNEYISDEQNGFRKGCGCVDQLESFTSIIETRKQQRKGTFVVFIDFSKAYDRIDRNLLWGKLSRLGLDGKMKHALEQIYNNVECCVSMVV